MTTDLNTKERDVVSPPSFKKREKKPFRPIQNSRNKIYKKKKREKEMEGKEDEKWHNLWCECIATTLWRGRDSTISRRLFSFFQLSFHGSFALFFLLLPSCSSFPNFPDVVPQHKLIVKKQQQQQKSRRNWTSTEQQTTVEIVMFNRRRPFKKQKKREREFRRFPHFVRR